MPPFSLLLRYDGTLVPLEIADAVASTQGCTWRKARKATRLEKIPISRYELWPYRMDDEAAAILSVADELTAPIQIDVRIGENRVAVQVAAR